MRTRTGVLCVYVCVCECNRNQLYVWPNAEQNPMGIRHGSLRFWKKIKHVKKKLSSSETRTNNECPADDWHTKRYKQYYTIRVKVAYREKLCIRKPWTLHPVVIRSLFFIYYLYNKMYIGACRPACLFLLGNDRPAV